MMKQPIAVTLQLSEDHAVIISCTEGESILDAMIRHGFFYRADCGGNGTCGKCRIQVILGELEITAQDQNTLTEFQLQQGWRLACKACPHKACTVRIEKLEYKNYSIISEDKTVLENFGSHSREETVSSCREADRDTAYAIAIDIGTTTIAIHLIHSVTGEIINVYTALNQQSIYGADVISRIKASMEGAKDSLKEIIRQELLLGITEVISAGSVDKRKVTYIVIAANTTMVHLLMGYPCDALGSYPFEPVNLNMIHEEFSSLFGSDDMDIPVIILPGISAFIGADIAAGLLACNFDRRCEYAMLIDLGTNGEIAIGNKDKILVSSTAAGPAFEGGNISCGIGSIAGAIDRVSIADGRILYHTIGEKDPIGICGTGMIDIIAELIKAEIIDDTGLLKDQYFDQGYVIAHNLSGDEILLTQKDIRELQMAKSAIRSGIEILMKRYQVSYEQIKTVYLAGGFGFQLSVENAVYIGLLPKEFSKKVKAVGNSALSGAVRYLTDASANQRIQRIISVSKDINLSNDVDFYDNYIQYINFNREIF